MRYLAIMIPAELTRAIEGHAHWTAGDDTAVYERPDAGFTVTVGKYARPSKPALEWYAALYIGGRLNQTKSHYGARDAVAWAEQLQMRSR